MSSRATSSMLALQWSPNTVGGSESRFEANGWPWARGASLARPEPGAGHLSGADEREFGRVGDMAPWTVAGARSDFPYMGMEVAVNASSSQVCTESGYVLRSSFEADRTYMTHSDT